MIAFGIAAAAMVAVALALLLPALLRRGAAAVPQPAAASAGRATLEVLRDQLAQLDLERANGAISAEQHALSRSEIERRVLDEAGDEPAPAAAPPRAAAERFAPRTAVVVALVVPVLAVGLYALLGSRAALAPEASVAAAPASGAQAPTAAQVEAMVDQLAKKMASQAGQPNELEGWVLLARSQAALQRLPEADASYAKAIALAPDNAALLADRAEVLMAMNGQSGVGQPAELLARALQLDPANLKALALSGSAAMDRKDFNAAIDFWGRARRLVADGSEFAQGLDAGIAEARSAGGTATANGAERPAAAPVAQAAASGARGDAAGGVAGQVQGSVRVAPALADKVAPGDTVFIFARAVDGPRMPLAILRRGAVELPIRFTLDDSLAMSPAMKLSNVARVVVGVRISKSGDALPKPGDLVGSSGPVPGGAAAPLDIVVDQIQP